MAAHTSYVPCYETEYLLALAIEQYYAEEEAQMLEQMYTEDQRTTYYAHYLGVPVHARLDGRVARLTTPDTDGVLVVPANDPHLVLHGRMDIVTAQRAVDAARGGYVARACA